MQDGRFSREKRLRSGVRQQNLVIASNPCCFMALVQLSLCTIPFASVVSAHLATPWPNWSKIKKILYLLVRLS